MHVGIFHALEFFKVDIVGAHPLAAGKTDSGLGPVAVSVLGDLLGRPLLDFVHVSLLFIQFLDQNSQAAGS